MTLPKNIIKLAQTKCGASMIIISVKNRTLRICVDNRENNAKTKRDTYRIPSIDKCIHLLENAPAFSPLEDNSRSLKIQIGEEDKDMATLSFHHGLYHFNRTPLRLRNALSTFKRTLKAILCSVKWKFALNYLYNIVVFSKTSKQDIHHVRKFLSLLHNAGTTLILRSNKFFTDTIDYQNHELCPRRKKLASHTTGAIRKHHPPLISRNYAHSFAFATSSDNSSLALLKSRLYLISVSRITRLHFNSA